jgi:hypothetical protein
MVFCLPTQLQRRPPECGLRSGVHERGLGIWRLRCPKCEHTGSFTAITGLPQPGRRPPHMPDAGRYRQSQIAEYDCSGPASSNATCSTPEVSPIRI